MMWGSNEASSAAIVDNNGNFGLLILGPYDPKNINEDLFFATSFAKAVTLFWNDIPDKSTKYRITKNDELISEFDSASKFSDIDRISEGVNNYRIDENTFTPESEWISVLTDEEIESIKDDKLDKPIHSFVWAMTVRTSKDGTKQSSEAALSEYASAAKAAIGTSFPHSTLIPDAWVHRTADKAFACYAPTPNGLASYFKGDNRLWSNSNGASHKSEIVANKFWGLPLAPSLIPIFVPCGGIQALGPYLDSGH